MVSIRVPSAPPNAQAHRKPPRLELIEIQRDYQHDLLLAGLKDFFGDFDDHLLDRVLPRLEWLEVAAGEVIFDAGSAGNELYFVVSGRLRATVRAANGEPRLLGEIMRGETIGEMSVVTGEPRTATITAVRSSVLVRLSREAFETLLAEFPLISVRLTRLIIERLRRSNNAQPLTRRPVNIALLPISDGIDVRALGEALAPRMMRFGSVLLLTGESIVDRFGRAALAATRGSADLFLGLTRWLDEVETQYDFILYIADDRDSAWTRRCLGHADEVLPVADATRPAALHRLEEALLAAAGGVSSAARRLVLLHPPTTRLPCDTSAWLAPRTLVGHVHLRAGDAGHLDRLARIVTGNASGLVLSGGGARGFAHLGIYRALVEAGIDIDYVGGTSMGAVIGSLIALDLPPAEALERIRTTFRASPVGDLNVLPFVSLVSGKRLDRHLERGYRQIAGHSPDIEDTWKRFFCIATSYSYAREVVIRRGPLAKLVRASVSIPAFLPPVYHDGEALIDGVIFNNFPTDEMTRMGVGRMIGVDFGQDNFGPVTDEAPPSAWRIIASKFGRRDRALPIPYLGGMIYNAPMLYSESRQQQSSAAVDLLIRPDMRSIGALEWKALDRAVDIGYRCARDYLERCAAAEVPDGGH